jgi:hypothetical protein
LTERSLNAIEQPSELQLIQGQSHPEELVHCRITHPHKLR